MTTVQEGILALLKSAITEEKTELPQGFTLEEAMPLIKAHGLYALVYAGALRCGFDKASPLMQTLFIAYRRAMLQSLGQQAELKKLYACFDEHHIDYMPVKGSVMKALYPAPELRSMGDADILIRLEQYDRIRPLMAEMGFEEQYESDHELVWLSKNLMVELHKCLIPTYNKDYYAYYGSGWRLASRCEGTHWFMTNEDHFVYSLTHFAKHYRDGGIGVRHLVDLWVQLRSFPELDREYIRAELAKLQLEEFYDNLLRVMAAWFGDGPLDEKSEFISQYIFSSGTWGRQRSHMLAARVKSRDMEGAEELTQAQGILQAVFPPYEAMKWSCPFVEGRPWLLPAGWVWRWIRAVLFRRKNVETFWNNRDVMTEQPVREFHDDLAYVGLAFRPTEETEQE